MPGNDDDDEDDDDDDDDNDDDDEEYEREISGEVVLSAALSPFHRKAPRPRTSGACLKRSRRDARNCPATSQRSDGETCASNMLCTDCWITARLNFCEIGKRGRGVGKGDFG